MSLDACSSLKLSVFASASSSMPLHFDRIFFLPNDVKLNPGHSSIEARRKSAQPSAGEQTDVRVPSKVNVSAPTFLWFHEISYSAWATFRTL